MHSVLLCSAVVQLKMPIFGASCIATTFLAPLRPSLAFPSPGSQDSGLSGLMLGARTNSTSPQGVAWQQDAAVLLYASAAQPVQLVAKAAGIKLPGTVGLAMKP